MTDATDRWDIRPDESSEAFEAFTAYRDMSPTERSIRSVGQNLGKSDTPTARSSRKHGSVERTRAHDADQGQRKRRDPWEARRGRLEWRNAHAGAMQNAGLRILQHLLSGQGKAALQRASARTAAELLRGAADLEDSAWEGLRELDTHAATEDLKAGGRPGASPGADSRPGLPPAAIGARAPGASAAPGRRPGPSRVPP